MAGTLTDVTVPWNNSLSGVRTTRCMIWPD
jgi:hypothetical protein